MSWAGHVAHMGEERACIGSWWGNRRERDQWGDLGVDGWIILGQISRRWNVSMWTGLGWPRIGKGGGSGNELSGSIKCGEFLDWLQTS